MGRFVVPLPQRSAFDRRPVATPQQGTTARDVYAALAAANQGVQLARAIAPDASTIGAIGRGLGLMGDDPAKFQASPEAMQWQNIDRDRLQATQAVEAQQAAAVSAESAAVQAVQGQLAKAQQQRVQEQMEQNEQALANKSGIRQGVPLPEIVSDRLISNAGGSYPAEGFAERRNLNKSAMDGWQQNPYQPTTSGIQMQRQPNAYMPDQLAPQQPAGPTAYEEMKRAALDAEREKSSQLYQKEKAAFEAAPKTASDVILAAKSAIAAGDADAYRTALQAVNRVDVSGMPEAGYGELFSDRGKRQRLVKLLAGMGVPKKSRSTASTPHQLEMEKQGRARNVIASEQVKNRAADVARKTTDQKSRREAKAALAPVIARLRKAQASKTEVQAKTAKALLDLGMPAKQVKKISSAIARDWSGVGRNRFLASDDYTNQQIKIRKAGRPVINVGARKALRVEKTKEQNIQWATKKLAEMRGKLRSVNATVKKGVVPPASGAHSEQKTSQMAANAKAFAAAQASQTKLKQQYADLIKVKTTGTIPDDLLIAIGE